MNLTLRWYSAMPIKQAFARAQFGDQAESTAELAELLAPEENHIIIGISGLPSRMTRIPPDRRQADYRRTPQIRIFPQDQAPRAHFHSKPSS